MRLRSTGLLNTLLLLLQAVNAQCVAAEQGPRTVKAGVQTQARCEDCNQSPSAPAHKHSEYLKCVTLHCSAFTYSACRVAKVGPVVAAGKFWCKACNQLLQGL